MLMLAALVYCTCFAKCLWCRNHIIMKYAIITRQLEESQELTLRESVEVKSSTSDNKFNFAYPCTALAQKVILLAKHIFKSKIRNLILFYLIFQN